ncbi:hypothetical protein Nepgr_002679 [Nepenthes gracilis]|uniref:Uncharacterized protein n=1 Tax=Nepenthes gracilis TaxID=150966 RepID=A0AAD3P456_NEPGR|nr:hypothetical protein Nepgr_002679 [Nepenthes gracilis]
MLYTWVSALLRGASEAWAVEWQFAGCLQIVSSADLSESSAEAGSGCTSSELTSKPGICKLTQTRIPAIKTISAKKEARPPNRELVREGASLPKRTTSSKSARVPYRDLVRKNYNQALNPRVY